MDTSAITQKLYNKSVKWIWEGKAKGIGKIKSYYDKIADVRPLKEMEGDPAILQPGIGPGSFQEVKEKQPIKFIDAIQGYTIYLKQRDYAIGSEISFRLSDNLDLVGMENFFKNFINSVVLPGAIPTIDKVFASYFLNGGLTAGHDCFNNSTKQLADPSGDKIYDNMPFMVLQGNPRTPKGHATTYYNLLAGTLDWDNAKAANVLLTGTNAVLENGEPFDNSGDKCWMGPTTLKDDAKVIFESEKDPTSGDNGINPLKGEYEIIANPYMNSQPTASVLQRKGFGITMYVNPTPWVRYWVVEENRVLRASAGITIAGGVTQWRGTVGMGIKTV